MTSAASAIMRLTPRDHALIRLLSELRYLTVSQVRQVCFPAASMTTASHRLTLLRRCGLLDCLTHRTFEDRRAFWCLAPLGRSVAAALADTGPDGPRARSLAALHLDHLIATNQIFCDLCTLYRSGRLGGFRWHGSHHAGIEVKDTRVVPDAAILTAPPDAGPWMYCVELDRGTMGQDALCAKFRRYGFLHRIAGRRGHEAAWGLWASSWVLFASAQPQRAGLAAQLAEACGVDRFWAGTPAELPAGLAESIGPECTCVPDALPGLQGGAVPPDAFEGSQ